MITGEGSLDGGSEISALMRARPMSRAQVLAVALCIVINMMDGFDILAASFTAPAIARDWALGPTDLGLLFSSGLAGMTVGALALSPLADRFGRRAAVMLFLALATAGLALSAQAPNLPLLAAARVLTGAGVAAAMAALNTVVAEYASDRARDLAVMLQAGGFPLGGLLGALAVYRFSGLGWREAFAGGAGLSLVLTAAAALWLPESLEFLLARRPADFRRRAERLLARFHLPPPDVWPTVGPLARNRGGGVVSELRGRAGAAALICGAFFALMFSFYFFTSWTPKLLTDLGLSGRSGVSGAVLMNLGGVVGDLAFGLLALRLPARRLAPALLALCAAAAAGYGLLPVRLSALLPGAFGLGVLLFAAMAALFALTPSVFPARARAAGTGLALGLGRLGAVAGPYVGGLLLAAGCGRATLLAAMAAPMLVAAGLSLGLGRSGTGDPASITAPAE